LNPLDLTLQNLDLTSENQHLSLELGMVAPARDDRVNEDAQERVEKGG
jgi:hypothetical protein